MWLFGRASFDLSRKLGLGGYLLVIEVLFFSGVCKFKQTEIAILVYAVLIF